MITRRDILLAGLLGGTGAVGLSLGLRPRIGNPRAARLLEDLPPTIGRWRMGDPGTIVLPPEEAISRTVYDGYVVRGYDAPGTARIVLLIAYSAGQSYALQLHRPEICYPASGFAIEKRSLLDAASIPAIFLTTRRGDTVEHVLYWTRVGDSFPRSVWEQRFATAGSVFDRGGDDAILVRMSLRGGSPEAALATLTAFARTLQSAFGPDQRGLLYQR